MTLDRLPTLAYALLHRPTATTLAFIDLHSTTNNYSMGECVTLPTCGTMAYVKVFSPLVGSGEPFVIPSPLYP